MDIFNIHNVKVEKDNAMLQYRRFRTIAKLFRLLELFVAVVLLSWISSRLPLVVTILCDYFRQLISIIVSQLFIFLIGNVIVVTLVLKSGRLTGNFSVVDLAGTDLYEEIVNNVTDDVSPVLEPEEIVYQDKRIISEVNSKPIASYRFEEGEIEVVEGLKKPVVTDLDLKTYRRSQSENLNTRECVVPEKLYGKLKRSETEIGRRKDDTPVEKIHDENDNSNDNNDNNDENDNNDNNGNVVDELSNEEFQRRIEGFIARQVRFHQEEKLSIVVPHGLI